MQLAGAALFTVLALAEAVRKGDVAELVLLPFRDKGFLIAVLYLGIGCSVFANLVKEGQVFLVCFQIQIL